MLVRELRDGLRLRLAAASAGEGLHTGLGFRRLLRHLAFIPCVAERIHVSIHVAVAAGAGVRRVTLGRAGRGRHNGLVAVLVRELRDGLRLRLAAARAGEGLHAVLSFGGGLRHFAFVPAMAEGWNLAGKGLAAARFGTDARLRARLGAGRLFFSGPFAEVMNGCIFQGIVVVTNFDFVPRYFCPSVVDISQIIAIIESRPANARHAVRNRHAGQRCAIIESLLSNARHAVRDRYACKRFAIKESRIANARHAVRDRHAGQRCAVSESIPANARHAVRDRHARQRSAMIESIITNARHAVRDRHTGQR